MRKPFWIAVVLIFHFFTIKAQETFPVNGVADKKSNKYAFINATIVKDPKTTIANGVLIIEDAKIIAVGSSASIPSDAVIIDCKEKYIYPSFIDIYTDYGITYGSKQPVAGFNFNAPVQFQSNTKGAYGWNQAIKPEIDAYKIFSIDDGAAKTFRDQGFGTVLTHEKDGIARGSGTVVTLANTKENLVIIKEKASAHYSFNKGSSTQSYPTSLMGSIALLRQTYYDARWYKNNPSSEGINISLQAWNNNQPLPQIFESDDKWNDLRADRIGDEFGIQYIIKAGGNEYQRMKEIAATNAAYILPLNFPKAQDVEDPNIARFVSLNDLKHWELAPTSPAAFSKANIPFALTSSDLENNSLFFPNLLKAISLGLSEEKALTALTTTPANLLNIYDKVGSIEPGKIANFLITNGPIFKQSSFILENWIQGEKYEIHESLWNNINGKYALSINYLSAFPNNNYVVQINNSNNAIAVAKEEDTLTGNLSIHTPSITLQLVNKKTKKITFRLVAFLTTSNIWNGTGEDSLGNKFTCSLSLLTPTKQVDSNKHTTNVAQPLAKITYPFSGYGFEKMPTSENLLIKNATIWTNKKDGILKNTDLLITNGKIEKIAKNISFPNAKIIDATGKHITAGIIDEHSHIAAVSINEGAQSVTSEVRIADNLNPDDINIYRQLSGGVTSSHILHGSANTIGGQTQLIKLRWGVNDEELKFKDADPFIKFALGENVKKTSSQNNNRFPNTRMGVEAVLNDAFTRAIDYEKSLKTNPRETRKDLELDAIVEILNKKRFITCHSYLQSEILSAIKIGEKYGFRFNTFTHVLEGYKVADLLKAHGSNVSTFSDWWAYKQEVADAIAYNAAIMHKVGLNVCINSDDAEQARRLNQEAAKTIKYGGIGEEDALKMVTLNPAIALHVDNRVGSIKIGKDADIVIWSDNPLSIYAKAEKTIIDGIVYFDKERDIELRKSIAIEKSRLIQKMIEEKRSNPKNLIKAAEPSWQTILSCEDHEQSNGLISIDFTQNNSSSY